VGKGHDEKGQKTIFKTSGCANRVKTDTWLRRGGGTFTSGRRNRTFWLQGGKKTQPCQYGTARKLVLGFHLEEGESAAGGKMGVSPTSWGGVQKKKKKSISRRRETAGGKKGKRFFHLQKGQGDDRKDWWQMLRGEREKHLEKAGLPNSETIRPTNGVLGQLP